MLMQRIAVFSALLAMSSIPFVGDTALAHGDKEVTVAPLTPRAGDTITVQGGGIGENRDIEIHVVGLGTDVDLGELQAADDGDFSGQLQLPATVKPGVYQVRAIGEDTLEAQVTIAGALSGTSTQATTTQSSTAATMAADPAETAKQRPLGEAAILVAIFGFVAALGLVFARTAHREPASKPA